MKIHDLMTEDVIACGPDDNAALIAEICWKKGCGWVPILDADRKVLGVVTDRDIFIALGTRNCRASELRASDVMTKDVATVAACDDVLTALGIMLNHRVRRLPVVDASGRLEGIVSVHDIARESGCTDVTHEAVMNVLTRLNERSESRGTLAVAQVGTT